MKKRNNPQPDKTKRKADKRRKKLKARAVASVDFGPQPQNTWFANQFKRI